MVQRTVLKVDISCLKCKKKLLGAVSGLQGVDKIEVDGAKGTLTITGDADPYEIIVRARRAGKFVEVVSVGPPPKPPQPQQQHDHGSKKPDDEKKPGEKKTHEQKNSMIQTPVQAHAYAVHAFPHSYPVYEQMPQVQVARWDEPVDPSCSIM